MFRYLTEYAITNPIGGLWTVDSIFMAILIFIAAIFIQALLVMLFWNLSLAKIFASVPCITFWQALFLSVLIGVLF